MPRQQVRIAGFDPEADFPAPGPFHETQKGGIDVFRPHRAVEGHAERPFSQPFAEFDHSFPMEGKLIVILDFEKIVTDISPETGLRMSDIDNFLVSQLCSWVLITFKR